MANTSVATAADYADAMLTARRFRTVLFWVLTLILVAQLALFFTARSSDVLDAQLTPPSAGTNYATTQANAVTTQPAAAGDSGWTRKSKQMFQYAIGLTGFAGIVLAILYSLVLLLLVNIMLVGRLIGISHMTKAFIWSLLLALLVFPWQAFLTTQGLDEEAFTAFKWPGVLYTWRELSEYHGFPASDLLKWGRFVIWPAVAMLMLMLAQMRSSRGLRLSLGEAELAAGPPARERPE